MRISAIPCVVSVLVSCQVASARLPSEDELRDGIGRRMREGPGTVVSLDSIIPGDWRRLYIFGAYTSRDYIERCVGATVDTRSIHVQDGYVLFVLEPTRGNVSSMDIRGGVDFGREALGRVYPRGTASFVVGRASTSSRHMLLPRSDLVSAAVPCESAVERDTSIVLGSAQRDLTGDGRLELLQVVGAGPTVDSLNAVFSIESLGRLIYRIEMASLTRTVGFDGPTRMRSPDEHRVFLAEFGPWFFGDAKFMRPANFISKWRESAPHHVGQIPSVIARDGGFDNDSVRAASIWNEMQQRRITIFEFSPGGDGIVAIGWSPRDRRFYRLVECC